jgi:hypothetical protein
MVLFYRQLLYIRGNSLRHKTKQPLFYLGIFRNVNNFYKIVEILFVATIPQQIQISVDQPYAGPAASCCGIIGTHSVSNNFNIFSTKKWEIT